MENKKVGFRNMFLLHKNSQKGIIRIGIKGMPAGVLENSMTWRKI